MFPGSDVTQKFSLGKTKSRYTMLYGISPEFMKALIYDLNGSLFYTISSDESLNSEMQVCKIDVFFMYWNDKKILLRNDITTLKFMRRPNTQNLFDSLLESMNDFDKTKLLQLTMDGLIVNWKVLDILDDKIIGENLAKTVKKIVVHIK